MIVPKTFQPTGYLNFMTTAEYMISKMIRSSEKFVPILMLFVFGILLTLKGSFYAKVFGFILIGIAVIMCMAVFRGTV